MAGIAVVTLVFLVLGLNLIILVRYSVKMISQMMNFFLIYSHEALITVNQSPSQLTINSKFQWTYPIFIAIFINESNSNDLPQISQSAAKKLAV